MLTDRDADRGRGSSLGQGTPSLDAGGTLSPPVACVGEALLCFKLPHASHRDWVLTLAQLFCVHHVTLWLFCSSPSLLESNIQMIKPSCVSNSIPLSSSILSPHPPHVLFGAESCVLLGFGPGSWKTAVWGFLLC